MDAQASVGGNVETDQPSSFDVVVIGAVSLGCISSTNYASLA
jgi:hypothetical protein